MEKILGQQGNAKSFSSSQDAKLMYQSEDLQTHPYLIDNLDEIKIGPYIIKYENGNLYIIKDGIKLVKINDAGINTKKINSHVIGGVNLK